MIIKLISILNSLLLIDPKGVDVIPFQVSSPNFIGNKKIISKIIYIDHDLNIKK